ncbi:MAG: hypothetical protein ACYC1E_12400 [Propionibacteriaceae bacterium]
MGSLVDLVDGLDVSEIRTYFLQAERGEYDGSGEARISVSARNEGGLLEVRCRLAASTEDCQVVVDRSAVFTLRLRLSIPEAVMGEFVEKVGVMTIYPYLREGAFSLASNLGVAPPVMGLLKAGSIRLMPQSAEESDDIG